MQVDLSVEQEAELSRIADETGRSAEVLAREAVSLPVGRGPHSYWG